MAAPRVTRMLTYEQKACRQQYSEENLDMLRANPEKSFKELLQRIKHESIIMIQRPNKSPCMETQNGPLLPRNFVCNNQPERSWQQFFWDSESVLHLKFMLHRTTIAGDTYASTIVSLRENIKQKRRGKLSAGVLLLHDNAPAHKSRRSRAAIRKWVFVELNQRPYSTGLASSDYFLFSSLKKNSAWASISR